MLPSWHRDLTQVENSAIFFSQLNWLLELQNTMAKQHHSKQASTSPVTSQIIWLGFPVFPRMLLKLGCHASMLQCVVRSERRKKIDSEVCHKPALQGPSVHWPWWRFVCTNFGSQTSGWQSLQIEMKPKLYLYNKQTKETTFRKHTNFHSYIS